jgi:aminopeptidase
MKDARLTELANILVNSCLKVKSLDKVLVRTSSSLGIPLVREVYKEIIKNGAVVKNDVCIEGLDEFFYKNATKEQLEFYPEFSEYEAKYFDKFLFIRADENIRSSSGVDQKKMLVRTKLIHKIIQTKLNKKWALTYFPTDAMAQEAKMDTGSFEDFFFTTTNQDWQKNKAKFGKIIGKLKNKTLRIVGEKTDITFETQGRNWIDNDYEANMPGGEIFTSPIKEKINGEIYFNYPLTYSGKTIEDIYLKFKDGEIIEFNASKNKEVLTEIIKVDQYSKNVGEIAFGMNPGCSFYMNNVLFDEKMAGTIHLALGNSFPECGGDHESVIHLDIIKDMKFKNSKVYADGELIYQNGKFL